MLESEKLAIAAHLHVLFRRKLGRVIDVEWLTCNREYAEEIIRISRSEPHPDVHEWAARLEAAVLRPAASPGRRTSPAPLHDEAPPVRRTDLSQRYVGRLR